MNRYLRFDSLPEARNRIIHNREHCIFMVRFCNRPYSVSKCRCMMAAVAQQKTTIARSGYVAVGEVTGGQISIRSTGTTVTVTDNLYPKTNFYIEQSRQYFPERKFRKYIYFYYFYTVYLLIFLGSFPTFLNFIYAFVMAAVNGAFLLMYIQHIFVIVTTMRYVIKQPSVPNRSLRANNDHIEIGVDVYNARYAASSNAGIGLLVHGSGKVKVQVFRNRAMARMKNTMGISTLCFIGSIGMVAYCLGMGITRVNAVSGE